VVHKNYKLMNDKYFFNNYLSYLFLLKKGLTEDNVYELSLKLRILLKFYVLNLFFEEIKNQCN